jgi:hypothetical protein
VNFFLEYYSVFECIPFALLGVVIFGIGYIIGSNRPSRH